MMNVTLLSAALTLIIAGFIMFLLIQYLFDRSLCPLCLAVTMTWVILLATLATGYITEPLIIGILMGQTVVGSYYVVRERLPSSYRLFSLPYILTLTAGAYMLLTGQIDLLSVLLLTGIWAVFIGLYAYRRHPRVHETVDAVIECCRDW